MSSFNPYHHPIPKISDPEMFNIQGHPYQMCPSCGQQPLKLAGKHYSTCPAHHTFYECPTCKDTRITDKRENVYYCGLLHPYHVCTVHKKPVIGISRLVQDCTCRGAPKPRRRPVQFTDGWDSPFL